MTFISPFDSLGENKKVEEAAATALLYTGSFACQTKDCYKVAVRAFYYPEERILGWKCPDGHESKIEDYAG